MRRTSLTPAEYPYVLEAMAEKDAPYTGAPLERLHCVQLAMTAPRWKWAAVLSRLFGSKVTDISRALSTRRSWRGLQFKAVKR